MNEKEKYEKYLEAVRTILEAVEDSTLLIEHDNNNTIKTEIDIFVENLSDYESKIEHVKLNFSTKLDTVNLIECLSDFAYTLSLKYYYTELLKQVIQKVENHLNTHLFLK